MKIVRNYITVLILVILTPGILKSGDYSMGNDPKGSIEIIPQASKYEWQLYDFNKDGRFDKADIDYLREKVWQGFEQDINRDGRKDINDALYLHVKLSVLDRSCNGVVDDEDFRPAARITLPPAPDMSTITALVSDCVTKSAQKLPPDIESQAFRSVFQDKVLSPDEKAFIYQLVGITSLAKRNLDGAKWGFGKAFQLKNESSLSTGSLAFCLAMEGRHEEALRLLSFARKLFPRSAATATTIGWIFARHGQNDEARKYYEEAVLFSPKTGQYHFNLGLILLRLGKTREAWEEFRKASELNPGDSKKFLFSWLTRPADVPPEDRFLTQGEFKQENAKLISEARKAGWSEEELPTPWDKQSCCEKAITVKEILEQKYQKQIEETVQVMSNDLAKDIEGVIKPYMPEWKDFCKDWKRYNEGAPDVYEEARALTINTTIAAGEERAAMMRKMGAELLSHSSEFMQCAVKEAEAEYKTELEKWDGMEDMIPAKTLAELKAGAYKEALKNAIDQCYKTPINIAYGYMTAESMPWANLPSPEVKTVTLDEFLGLFMAMPLACLKIPGYCNEKNTCYTPAAKAPENSTGDVFSIDLWIVSFEYNYDSGEWEFNVDLGITLGVTWTPSTGFGFQAGFDVSAGFIAGVEAGFYFKYDEGDWTYEENLGLYTRLGPFTYTRQESGRIFSVQVVPEEP